MKLSEIFKRINIFKYECENCGKKANIVEISPDGDDYHFCSGRCRQEYTDTENASGRFWRVLGVYLLNKDGSAGKSTGVLIC